MDNQQPNSCSWHILTIAQRAYVRKDRPYNRFTNTFNAGIIAKTEDIACMCVVSLSLSVSQSCYIFLSRFAGAFLYLLYFLSVIITKGLYFYFSATFLLYNSDLGLVVFFCSSLLFFLPVVPEHTTKPPSTALYQSAEATIYLCRYTLNGGCGSAANISNPHPFPSINTKTKKNCAFVYFSLAGLTEWGTVPRDVMDRPQYAVFCCCSCCCCHNNSNSPIRTAHRFSTNNPICA